MGFNVILQEEEINEINVEALKGSELSSAGLEKMEPLIKLKTCTVFVCCSVAHSRRTEGTFKVTACHSSFVHQRAAPLH